MHNNSKPKPWPCPNCGHNLGMVAYGQLVINDHLQANTDGSNLVLKCPKCGNRKVWYGSDRLTAIEREIAQFVSEKIQDFLSDIEDRVSRIESRDKVLR